MPHDIIYWIVFESGEILQEYGQSEQDVREFLERSYKSSGPIKSIEPYDAEKHGDCYSD